MQKQVKNLLFAGPTGIDSESCVPSRRVVTQRFGSLFGERVAKGVSSANLFEAFCSSPADPEPSTAGTQHIFSPRLSHRL
jgi:hypothetical protein